MSAYVGLWEAASAVLTPTADPKTSPTTLRTRRIQYEGSSAYIIINCINSHIISSLTSSIFLSIYIIHYNISLPSKYHSQSNNCTTCLFIFIVLIVKNACYGCQDLFNSKIWFDKTI